MRALDDALTQMEPQLDGALAAGLRQLRAEATWSHFELAESLGDLLRLSAREDACYDRPSSGWAYGSWYHGRRVQTALRLLEPSLVGQTASVTIADLGSGTGATAWAVAALAIAARSVGHAFPVVHIVGIEASEPMVRAARVLWGELARSAPCQGVLGSEPRFELATWTDLAEIELPEAERGLVVGGYLFDDSDLPVGLEIGRLLGESLAGLAGAELLLVGSAGKHRVVEAVATVLARSGWSAAPVSEALPPWSGALDLVARERAEGLQGVPGFDRLPAKPSWTNHRESPRFYRFTHENLTGRLFDPAGRRGFALDDDQDQAATPDGRMTAIIGAAGSGKSRILVERAVRTIEEPGGGMGSRDVLISTFNNDMVGLLVNWVEERLVGSGFGTWTWTEDRDDFVVRGVAGRRDWSIRLMTWDKVPSRILGVQPAGPQNHTALAVDRRLRELAIDRSSLTDAQQRVLDPDFLEAELRRVIYGLGAWEELDHYQGVERRGRRSPLSAQQKNLIWSVVREGTHRTWSHYRMEGLAAAREAAKASPPPFEHVFIDECQDMTPADFELVSLLVSDPNRIVVVGDEAQSMHLGASYQRPGQIDVPASFRGGDQPAFRLWNTHHLRGSYRLPVRVCECVRPIAEALLADRTALRESHDVEVPEAKKPAVLGARPIVVSAKTMMGSLKEIFSTYGELLRTAPEATRQITVAEGGIGLDELRNLAPPDCPVGSAGMSKIKGLERACIIWPTWQPNRSHESALEWAYTILTRSAGLAIIAVDATRLAPESALALTTLREDRLLYWDEDARAEMECVRATIDRPK